MLDLVHRHGGELAARFAHMLEAATVMFATGFRPSDELVAALESARCEVHAIGDCTWPCGILEGIHDGARAGQAL